METVLFTIDFAMVIVALIVQILIYPSFIDIEKSRFTTWHARYTGRIALFVVPLMLSQLVGHSYFSFSKPGFINILQLGLVLLTWWITFQKAVPLHDRLQKEGNLEEICRKLLRVNLLRLIPWILICLSYLGYSF